MNTISLRTSLDGGTTGFGTSSPTKRRSAGATEEVSPIIGSFALELGNVLRIKNGRGTRVRAASGELWITEENGHTDHVLLPGDAIDLANTGMAIAFAQRTARVVVEVPAGVAPPRAVELASAEGESGRSIRLAERNPMSLSPIATGFAIVIRHAAGSIRRMVTTLRTHWSAASTRTETLYVPMTYSDGFPPWHERRRMMRDTREVERAAIGEWKLWRM